MIGGHLGASSLVRTTAELVIALLPAWRFRRELDPASEAMRVAQMSLAELGAWSPLPDRADPLALLEAQEQTRIGWLIPERHRRMAASAFACFRGSPVVMAADLGRAAHSGLEVQLCGDAHRLNFGFYASPERGSFAWDLKRLVCSLARQAGPPWRQG